MKQYKKLISEIAFLKKILADYKTKKELYDAIESIEAKYPGVTHFLYAASRWASDVSPNKNRELYNLLVRMSGKESIHDFNDSDLRSIYKYIMKDNSLRKAIDSSSKNHTGVHDYEEFESHFIEATEDE